MTSFERAKTPFKLVEIPVNNFKEIAIPHHLKLLADHKEIVQNVLFTNNKLYNLSYIFFSCRILKTAIK